MNHHYSNIETFRRCTGVRCITSWLTLLFLTSSLVFLFTSCEQPFNLIESLDGQSEEIIDPGDSSQLTLNPISLGLYINSSAVFTATGGVPPYTFTVLSGLGSIDSSTGIYTAPSTAGTAVIQVSDNEGEILTADISIVDVLSNVDYNTITVSNTGGNAGGTALSGNFSFTNNGSGDGVQTVSWQVYTSLDATIGAGDSLIDSGTTDPLNNGVTSPLIIFSGSWPTPASDTTYYVIVQISAIDDLEISDNSGNASVTVTAPVFVDIDYIIQSISNSPSGAEVNSSISQSFVFTNQGSAPGVLTVYWKAYISADQILDGGDTHIDNGSLAALTSSASSGSINISGNWPASSGIYYLITQVSSGDDTDPSNNYTASASFTINAATTDIDYIVTNVSKNYPTVTSDSLCSETFDLTNVGGLNGAQPIDWTAYASMDDSTLEIGTDAVIDSGTLSALNAGFGYSSLSISGAWPALAGNYFIILDISSVDETITGNNTAENGPFTVKDPPDYIISSATFQIDGEAGTPLSTFGTFDFTISELNGSSGSIPLSWEVLVSNDIDLISIKTGNIPALSAESTSAPIFFADALWPAFGSDYFIMINIYASDDGNSLNNTIFSPNISVPEVYEEGAEDNSDIGITSIPLVQVTDLGSILEGGILDANEHLRVDGTMDANLEYDTYKLTLGPTATSIDVSAFWNTGSDDIDFYLWDENDNQWSSLDGLNDKENTNPFSGLVSGATYYIGVNFKSTALPGASYTLEIQGD